MSLAVKAAVLVNAVGMPPFLLLARSDINQVSMLDTYSANQVANIVWQTGPLDGGPDGRGRQKRIPMITLYGEGTLATGANVSSVTILCDGGARAYTFPVSAVHARPKQDILVQLGLPPDVIGSEIEVTFNLTGNAILLRGVKVEFVVLR